MTVIDEYKLMVEAYYGVMEIDEYDLKVYMLKEIENYIIDCVNQNKVEDFNYKEASEYIKDNVSLKTKLQSSLILLNKINAPIDLILLIKSRLKKM